MFLKRKVGDRKQTRSRPFAAMFVLDESPTTISQTVLAITSNSFVLNVNSLQETVEGIHPNNHDGAEPNVLLGRCENCLLSECQ